VASGEAPTTTTKVEPPDECGPSAAGEQVAVSTGEVAETGEATPMDAPTACEQVAATSDKAIDTTARVTYTRTAAATGEIAETGEATPMDAPHCMREGIHKNSPPKFHKLIASMKQPAGVPCNQATAPNVDERAFVLQIWLRSMTTGCGKKL
jgi:hypothetical protein